MKIANWSPECMALPSSKPCVFCGGEVGEDGAVFRKPLEGWWKLVDGFTLEFAHRHCALRFAPELLDAVSAEQCLDVIAARIHAAERFNQPGRA